MKRTLKILIFLMIVLGVLFVSTTISEAATNGVVIPFEDEVDVKRTDSGNTITLKMLNEGTYYQPTSELSQALRDAIAYDKATNKVAGVRYYIPVPADAFGTYVKAEVGTVNEDGTVKETYDAIFYDENFEQIASSLGLTADAKYIQQSLSVAATVYSADTNWEVGVESFLGGEKTIQITYYDADGKASEATEYTISVEPVFSNRELDLKMTTQYGSTYSIYNGDNSTTPQNIGITAGETSTLTPYSLRTDKAVTSKVTYASDNEEVLKVDEKGKITTYVPGTANVTVKIEEAEVKVKFTVYPESYFTEEITDEQFENLIIYAETIAGKDDPIGYTTEKDTIIPAKLFQEAKRLNKELIVNIYTEKYYYTWAFKPGDITDTTKDLNIEVNVVDPFIDELADQKDNIYIDFTHSGKLPGKAKITVTPFADYDTSKEPTEKYLYFYNETTKKCEFVQAITPSDFGDLTFTLDHCSKYVITTAKLEGAIVGEETTTNQSSDKGKLDDEPKTGESFVIESICYTIATISLLGIATYIRKK